MKAKMTRMFVAVALMLLVTGWLVPRAAQANISGAIYTSLANGTTVNQNLYDAKEDVYLNGGPQNQNGKGIPDGDYYFQVTDPSTNALLSTDNAVCRQLTVSGGVVAGAAAAAGSCAHDNGTFNPANGSTPVRLIPYLDTPNPGKEYKVELVDKTCESTSIDTGDPKVIHYDSNCSKSDNFKVGQHLVCNKSNNFCTALMPLHKTVAGRGEPVCEGAEFPDPFTGEMRAGPPCTDPIVGDVAGLFTVGLFPNVGDGQPFGFPIPIVAVPIPPELDPPAPWDASFAICELNLPDGWYLPEGGVTTVATFADLTTDTQHPDVYTPDASADDSNRCFNVVIPHSVTFEIFIENVPSGTIVVSKTTVGGDGNFNFSGTGDGRCLNPNSDPTLQPYTKEDDTNLCTGLDSSFSIQTTGGSGPDQTFTVEARINFDTNHPAYKVTEDSVGGSVSDLTTNWDTTVDCGEDVDNTSFGVAPGETVTCAFRNVYKAKLELRKRVVNTVQTTDPGLFDLKIDNLTPSSVGPCSGSGSVCGSTGQKILSQGTYSVSETIGSGSLTALTDYTQSITCTGTNHLGQALTGLPTGVLATSTSVTLHPGDTVVCDITNTRKTGSLTIRKTTLLGIGTFSFTGSGGLGGPVTLTIPDITTLTPGTPVQSANSPITVITGDYTINETGVTTTPATTLDDWTTTVDCGTPTSNGRSTTVSVAANSNVVCTFTNTKHVVAQRTIGYWANWNSCSGGEQTQAQANPPSFWLDLYIGSVSIGNVLMDTCPHARYILQKRDFTGANMSSDGAYNMGAQLLGAKLNVAAGADQCTIANQAIAAGDALLIAIGFDGTGSPSLPSGNQPTLVQQRRAYANTLASILDQYNNLTESGKVCSQIVPSSLPAAP